jgi:hypothetical protein
VTSWRGLYVFLAMVGWAHLNEPTVNLNDLQTNNKRRYNLPCVDSSSVAVFMIPLEENPDPSGNSKAHLHSAIDNRYESSMVLSLTAAVPERMVAGSEGFVPSFLLPRPAQMNRR